MKVTVAKNRLKQIIKEEVQKVLKEGKYKIVYYVDTRMKEDWPERIFQLVQRGKGGLWLSKKECDAGGCKPTRLNPEQWAVHMKKTPPPLGTCKKNCYKIWAPPAKAKKPGKRIPFKREFPKL
jgi:hypothetical protein